MAKVSTNISLDAETKAKAQELLAELGLDLSTAINVFLKQVVRDNAIPFIIGKAEPNALTRTAIENAQKEIDMHGPFDNVSSVMEALNA